jgi:glycosyltransferase involved in cell wall biosynthesis
MVKNIIYLGSYNPKVHKRGVEVAIHDQSISYGKGFKFHIFFGKNNEIFRWYDIISIGIKNDIFKYIRLNKILIRLYHRFKKNIIIHSHSPIKTCFSIFMTDILTVHDAIYYQYKNLGGWRYPFCYFIEKIAYLKTKKIHFISAFSYSQSLLSKSRFEKDGIIIYDTTPVEVYMKNIKIMKNPYITNNNFNIFTVRGIQERTRIDLLLDFAEYIKEKNIHEKKIHVYIAGKGPMLDYYMYEQQKRDITNVTFLGYISDELICAYYNYCDIVIMPSENSEGFGLPTIEAYYFNKPVIASNRCAIPEIIISKEFLFENTPESIWERLCYCKTLNFNYKYFYNLNYSNKVIFDKYRKLYEKVNKDLEVDK